MESQRDDETTAMHFTFHPTVTICKHENLVGDQMRMTPSSPVLKMYSWSPYFHDTIHVVPSHGIFPNTCIFCVFQAKIPVDFVAVQTDLSPTCVRATIGSAVGWRGIFFKNGALRGLNRPWWVSISQTITAPRSSPAHTSQLSELSLLPPLLLFPFFFQLTRARAVTEWATGKICFVLNSTVAGRS